MKIVASWVTLPAIIGADLRSPARQVATLYDNQQQRRLGADTENYQVVMNFRPEYDSKRMLAQN